MKRSEVFAVADFSDVHGGLQVTQARGSLPIEVPYLRVANVYRDRLDLREVKRMRVTAVELERATLCSGDILVVEGHGNPEEIGRSAVWTGELEPCVHQNHLMCIRVNEAAAVPTYVSAYLNSPIGRQQLIRTGKTTTGLNTINISNVRAVRVPLPPLPEQRRIAAILDKADAIRRKRKEAIALTEELLRSAFLDMFGDPVTNPKGWSVQLLGDTFGEEPRIGTLVPASDDGECLVVRVGELGSCDVAIDRCKRASLSNSELARFVLKTGDVVLARAIGSEDHLGKASVLQEVREAVAFDSHVMRLRFNMDFAQGGPHRQVATG